MSRPARNDPAVLQSQSWSRWKLDDLPGVAAITYGRVQPGRYAPEGVPLLQAGDILDGTIVQTAPMRIDESIHDENARCRLEFGDLVIVLVGRVGDSALVGKDQARWIAARSVGVVRFTAEGRAWGVDAWLRRWLRAPETREWINHSVSGSGHVTLSVSALRDLPVVLPPLDRRRHLLHGIDLLEQRRHLNTRLVAHAVELADVHFERSGLRHAGASTRLLAEVAEVINGVALPKVPTGQGASAAWAAPAEVLQSSAPYLDRTARTMPASEHVACTPGVVLVAPRPGEVKAVMSRIPMVPGRGTAALRPSNDLDGWWLLHELRSRSRDLGVITQGAQAREISVKALSRLKVSWPDVEVRRSFTRVASLLHERAYAALKENRVLGELISADLTEGAPSQYRTALT
jgi:hypothetical protein